jgi:hypothetical protein
MDETHTTTDEELRNARVVVDGDVSEVKDSSPNLDEGTGEPAKNEDKDSKEETEPSRNKEMFQTPIMY